MRKERSASGGLGETLPAAPSPAPPASPGAARRAKQTAAHPPRAHQALTDLTVFHVPGLQLKVGATDRATE